jgi:hypothetical protein
MTVKNPRNNNHIQLHIIKKRRYMHNDERNLLRQPEMTRLLNETKIQVVCTLRTFYIRSWYHTFTGKCDVGSCQATRYTVMVPNHEYLVYEQLMPCECPMHADSYLLLVRSTAFFFTPKEHCY